MAVIKRVKATLPQAKFVTAGTLQRPKRRPTPKFAGNSGTGGRRK